MIEPEQRFGEWLVLKRVANQHNQAKFLCKCSCGDSYVVAGTHLKHGNSTKCVRCVGKSNSKNAAIRNQNKYSCNRRMKWVQRQVEDLYKGQSGKCPICNKPLFEETKTQCIDHNHQTGQSRALVHRSCNVLIGIIERHPERIKNVEDYLAKHSAN